MSWREGEMNEKEGRVECWIERGEFERGVKSWCEK